MVSFWKHIRQENKSSISYHYWGCDRETDIPEMWQDYYKSILNSVNGNFQQHFVSSKINSIREESILFSTSDINIALHSLKCGKSCGVDGLAADHFKYAHRISHVFLSLLLTLLFLMDICQQIL